MVGVWMTPCKNGQCELSVRRDGINKIVIATKTPLTDAQAEELFWCVGAMQRSGKTMKDLLKEQEKENSRINNSYLDLVKVASKQPDIVRCKDCAKYDQNTGICSGGIKHGCAETWFCADGEPKDNQLAYADNDTAQYADAPTMMSAT